MSTPEPPRPQVSVCIVTGHRPRLLRACLQSLQAQRNAPAWELLICSDRDRGLHGLVGDLFPDAVIGLVDRALPGAARNFLIERARGDLLLFLDDDVVVRSDLLTRLVKVAAAHPEATVFGGPNQTPPGSTTFQIVQGAVLASIVASGPVRRRYGPHPPGPADERSFTLCNLAVRREAMRPFARDLVCAEENGVLTELSRRGDLMRYDPHLVAFHERRPDVRGFARQMFKYGRGRGQLIVRDPSSIRVAHLAPSALLLITGASVAGALVTDRAWMLAPVGLYAAAVVAASAKISWAVRRRGSALIAGLLILVLHGAYGIGVVAGLIGRRRRGAASHRWEDLAPGALPGPEGPSELTGSGPGAGRSPAPPA